MQCKVARAFLTVASSAFGLAFLTSCGPDAPPSPEGGPANVLLTNPLPDQPLSPAPRRVDPVTGNRGAPAVPPNFDSPIPPRDAQWTVLVYTQRGPTHVTDANTLKNQLITQTGRHDWYVIHSRDDSNIYFGYYRAFDDPKDPATKVAQADLDFVKGLQLLAEGGQPVKPFEHCGFVSIAAPDPAAPPEWNLFNKDRDKKPKDPARAYWSLQIMAFKANGLRKEAAVQAVEALRKNGVEAYFYHGDTVSSVCVGAWPMDAVEQQNFRFGYHPADMEVRPQDTLFVYSGPVPAGMPKIDHDDQGNKVVQLAPVLNIKDETLKQAISKYPFHAVNYDINRIKGADGKDHEDPSFLVVVPRSPGDGFYDSPDVTPSPLEPLAEQDPSGTRSQVNASIFAPSRVPGPTMSRPPESIGVNPTPPPAPTPGVGHLRRLGD